MVIANTDNYMAKVISEQIIAEGLSVYVDWFENIPNNSRK